MTTATADRVDRVRAKARARYEAVLDDPAIARDLEIVTWNSTIATCDRDGIPLYWDEPRFRFRYTTRVLSLAFNLRKNDRLRARLLDPRDRGVTCKKLVHMTPQQMCPEMWEETYQRVAVRQLRRECRTHAADAPDGAYTCRRCKSAKTVYTAMQIRSADEPMTVFVTCLTCGKNWKD